MRRLLCAAAALAFASTAAPDPVTWGFEGAPAKPVKAGSRFSLTLVAHIQEGWHLYSLKPMEEGPIPTRIWLPDGQPFALAAAVGAPAPEVRQDPSFNMEVELYEGEAAFTLPLAVAAGTPSGARALTVNASYQTCNNKLCLPPKTVKVEVPLTVSR
jgi:DsbC/DsbD-like thiol-disulfide interchange protein